MGDAVVGGSPDSSHEVVLFSRSFCPGFRRSTLAVFGLALMLAGCTPPPEEGVDRPHIEFPLAGAHDDPGCGDCHVQGAFEQGLVDAPGPFVNAISTDCRSCHIDTELSYREHSGARSCADSGCHSLTDPCWAEVSFGCGPPPPPVTPATPVTPNPTDPPPTIPPTEPPTAPQGGHQGDLANRFPLAGPHLRGCSECHVQGDFSTLNGQANSCESCHPRVDVNGPGANHYPGPVAADDASRGCKACHSQEDAFGTLQVGATFPALSVVHDFIIPHRTATTCDSCHAAGPYGAGNYSCDGCHPNAAGFHPIDISGQACHDCHQDGR